MGWRTTNNDVVLDRVRVWVQCPDCHSSQMVVFEPQSAVLLADKKIEFLCRTHGLPTTITAIAAVPKDKKRRRAVRQPRYKSKLVLSEP